MTSDREDPCFRNSTLRNRQFTARRLQIEFQHATNESNGHVRVMRFVKAGTKYCNNFESKQTERHTIESMLI